MQFLRLKGIAVAAVAAAAIVGSLVVTPAAGAAITATSITTPTDPSFFIADNDAASQTFAISGTTTGGTTGDHVDVNCYRGTDVSTVAAGVAVNADGSFSVPSADMNGVFGQDAVCTLRAVPAGTTPSDLTPFAGPLIGVGERDSYVLSGGASDGTLFDYFIYAPQRSAAFDFLSLGSCGLCDGYLFDSTSAYTTTTYYANATLFGREGSPGTRSELQIDGGDAYAPPDAQAINPDAAGIPALTYSYSVDQTTGNLVIHETNPLVKCPDATYPPTVSSCASFVSAGVTDERTITTDHDGHLSWITDVFSSTDGNSHTLDLLWQNDQRFHGSQGDSSQVEYQFPGESGYSTHIVGDTVSLAGGPGTIFIRMHGAADGDTSTGQGAIVYDTSSDRATFNYLYTTYSAFLLHQTASVPASGSAQIRFAYIQDYQSANVASLATLATNTFKGCTVPKVTGKSLKKAKAAITHAGCSVGKVKKAFSKKIKKGRVISSKPKAGKHLGYQAKVALTVSKGAKK
jgi:PASTA domain-containing protein